MNFIYKIESVLITITAIFCTILLFKLLHNLRSALLWRVNCWFCNCNTWVKFPERNCWICPKCEQYNGFTKDGDYNKALNIATEQSLMTKNVFQKSSPQNGLCKMCNINQQLKVTQLANFVPMNEKKFNEEIESYRLQLEKAYKLCSPCRKLLQCKLHKEKETFLGSKLLETRSPNKNQKKIQNKQNHIIQNIINGSSAFIAGILLILVLFELYDAMKNYTNLMSTMHNVKDIIFGLFERMFTIFKMKMFITFPSLESTFYNINETVHVEIMNHFEIGHLHNINDLIQKALGCFMCFVQILGHFLNTNKTNFSVIIDLLWTVFAVTSIAHNSVVIDQMYQSLIKLTCILGLMYQYTRSRKLKNLAKVSTKYLASNCLIENDDSFSLDTDDDVSLSKFGLHNITDSSSDSSSPVNNTLMNGRSFTPRTDSVWGNPKLNSTFRHSPAITKSPSSVSDTVFIKPSFNKYQNVPKSDTDSELDESISSLCISKKKGNTNSNPVFGLQRFTASPNFVVPTPLNHSRPLISPSKLGHSTSWVAGGYWGSEGERPVSYINGSRSSSQSSGFESQSSSNNHRNLFSHPPSREESVCGEPDRNSLLFDRFKTCNTTNYNFQNGSGYTSIHPVFPQMQYNKHVMIPQPNYTQRTFVPHNVFARQQSFPSNSLFKAPGGSRLIKLPQNNSFTSC